MFIFLLCLNDKNYVAEEQHVDMKDELYKLSTRQILWSQNQNIFGVILDTVTQIAAA